MSGNLFVRLARRARSNGWWDRPAFHAAAPDGAVTYTHGEAYEAAARAATVLAAAGVRPGGRVLIALPDSIEFVAAFLGVLRLGALAVFAGPWQSAPEHAEMVAGARPSVGVCPPGPGPRFGGAPGVT